MSLIQRFRQMGAQERSENLWGWLLVSPWLLGFLALTLGPMIASAYLSFTDWDILTPPRWVGLRNFIFLFTRDEIALLSFRLTITYALLSVPLRLILGLAIALLMNQQVRGIYIFRTIYYLPAVLSGVAVALLWRWVFNSEFGLVNTMLWRLFGIQGPAWLVDPQWVMSAFIVMSLWDVGSPMLIYLAGLQGIPTDLYEAAEVDGANTWQRFWSVTLPLMTPVLFFNLVIGIIGALQVFTQAFIITEGGPNNATMFSILYMYLNAFRFFKMGYASAIAWLLFLLILALTLVVFRSSSLWVHYEGEVKGRSAN
ncbi:MAG TPA: sugar ABC transporter permease [Caldilineaceae bacterium]|nr:sugar ABC transporter permease [Caldilineaceae bacterium]